MAANRNKNDANFFQCAVSGNKETVYPVWYTGLTKVRHTKRRLRNYDNVQNSNNNAEAFKWRHTTLLFDVHAMRISCSYLIGLPWFVSHVAALGFFEQCSSNKFTHRDPQCLDSLRGDRKCGAFNGGSISNEEFQRIGFIRCFPYLFCVLCCTAFYLVRQLNCSLLISLPFRLLQFNLLYHRLSILFCTPSGITTTITSMLH